MLFKKFYYYTIEIYLIMDHPHIVCRSMYLAGRVHHLGKINKPGMFTVITSTTHAQVRT